MYNKNQYLSPARIHSANNVNFKLQELLSSKKKIDNNILDMFNKNLQKEQSPKLQKNKRYQKEFQGSQEKLIIAQKQKDDLIQNNLKVNQELKLSIQAIRNVSYKYKLDSDLMKKIQFLSKIQSESKNHQRSQFENFADISDNFITRSQMFDQKIKYLQEQNLIVKGNAQDRIEKVEKMIEQLKDEKYTENNFRVESKIKQVEQIYNYSQFKSTNGALLVNVRNQNNQMSRSTDATTSNWYKNRNSYVSQVIDRTIPDKVQYTFSIVVGNNSDLVRKVLSQKTGWIEVPLQSDFQFRWQPTSFNFQFDLLSSNKFFTDSPYIRKTKLRCFNHFEYHRELSIKSHLLHNLSNQCCKLKKHIFDITPHSYIIDFDDPNIALTLQQVFQIFDTNTNKKNMMNNQNYQFLVKEFLSKPSNDINKNLIKISKKMNQIKQIREINIPESINGKNNIWLLKCVDLNRGNGIHILNSLSQLCKILREYQKIQINSIVNGFQRETKKQQSQQRPKTHQAFQRSKAQLKFILQKYIEQPCLFDNRKFDIRVWVLLTHKNQIYFFKEGYLRTSSTPFSINGSDLHNPMIHLTNNAVQKYSQNYGSLEDGNQVSFKNYQQYLDIKKINFQFSLCVSKMKEISLLTVQSVRDTINSKYRQECFEIFGFDYILDSSYRTWLIEVNTNPCLEESSQLLKQLIPRMLDDCFKLTLDQIYPFESKNKNIYKVDGYQDDDNLWDYLGNL